MNIETFTIASKLQERIKEAAQTIANIDPEHSGTDWDEIRFDWEFYDDTKTILLRIYSNEEYNDSCSCHPNWQTRQAETTHEFPADQIWTADFLNDDPEFMQPSFSASEYYKTYEQKLRAKKEEEERLRREQIARDLAAKEKLRIDRDRAEFERLNKIFGK